MLEKYIYIPLESLNKVDGCGLKLSEWAERHINFDGVNKKFIRSLLNPRDDYERFKSKDFRCVKLEVEESYCQIAEGALYDESLMDLYIKSIVPSENYVLGTYIKPECLISRTVFSHEMKGANKRLTYPIFYENSYRLYISSILESLREKDNKMDEILLYYYYEGLAQRGKTDRIESKEGDVVIFTDKEDNRNVVLNIPKVAEDVF